jgi:hypothetical protein
MVKHNQELFQFILDVWLDYVSCNPVVVSLYMFLALVLPSQIPQLERFRYAESIRLELLMAMSFTDAYVATLPKQHRRRVRHCEVNILLESARAEGRTVQTEQTDAGQIHNEEQCQYIHDHGLFALEPSSAPNSSQAVASANAVVNSPSSRVDALVAALCDDESDSDSDADADDEEQPSTNSAGQNQSCPCGHSHVAREGAEDSDDEDENEEPPGMQKESKLVQEMWKVYEEDEELSITDDMKDVDIYEGTKNLPQPSQSKLQPHVNTAVDFVAQ